VKAGFATPVGLFAALALGLGLTAAPASAGTGPLTARSTTIISGPAGTSTTLRLTATARLNNAGADVTLTSPGSQAVGVLLVRTDDRGRYADQDFYVETYATDLGLCGGPPCPVPLPVRAWAWSKDATHFSLHPGNYDVVLLGEDGRQVTARFNFRAQPTGRLTERAAGPRMGTLTVDAPAVSASGHDFYATGYHAHYAKQRMFVGNLGMFAFSSPGVLDYQNCLDVGGGPPPPPPTLCLGGGGATPQPAVATKIGGTIYGTDSPIAYGPPDGHYGLGYDIAVAGPGVDRIRVADYQIVLPW
jgi:hypothetical protein